ncbi:DUF429 domain-containing protein [Kribbella sp. NPDC054772]
MTDHVLGVDACRKGWVGITGDLRAYFGVTIADLVAAAEQDGELRVIGIDIPIGLPSAGPRQADALARTAVAARLVRRSGPTLTDREVEILNLLATGLSNRTLARRLFVSEATIKSHLAHIYTKLEVDTRAAAVARAIDQRIIRRSS